MRRIVPLLYAVVLLFASCASDPEGPSATAGSLTTQAPDDRETAPDFTIETLDGDTFRLSDQRGTPVVLNFWAPWCSVCRAEQPHINPVAEARDDVLFFGIAWKADEDACRAFIDEFEVPYESGLDRSEDIFRSYRVNYQPATVFIDADGRIAQRIAGEVTSEQLEDGIDAIAS